MNSNKQRRKEIMERRRVRTAQKKSEKFDPRCLNIAVAPLGAVAADPLQLLHNNTYSPLPTYYIDLPFICRDCGKEQLWLAAQQKWWYEVIKGHINSTAVRCLACRRLRRTGICMKPGE
ncbi:MAG: zinc-ribbon domain-containing protein [Burkholderiaceae bacterium]|nr:zinc-ribbon domain-containing protein [Burkholderiaceae bacterium]